MARRVIINVTILLILVKNYFALSENESIKNNSLGNRTPKFWGFGPGIVRFENSLCTGRDGLDGTCYTRFQCRSIDGILSGKCRNVGTCCVVQKSCGGTSSYNNTYFVNPGFPATYSGGGSCSITIQRCNEDICQVRIDFLSLTLSQPNADGLCDRDALMITGGVGRFTPICGENSGLHIYVDFNGGEDMKLTIITSSAASLQRSWKLKIAQIGCSCPSRAPPGCLMYYADSSGTVTSFNFDTAVSATATRQIASTSYGICIARRPGFCSIEWSQTGTNTFSVSGDSGTPTPGTTCATDYVTIPNSGVDKFCGSDFTGVTSSITPFVLMVVTNANEMGDIANRGFSLSYSQRACGAMG